jgi:5-methylcytosine-specific restriction endonuclease McrA
MADQPDLLDFINNKMQMTEAYQPLIIKALIAHGGEATEQQLAEALLLGSADLVEKAKSRLRYPLPILQKHRIIEKVERGVWRLTAQNQEPEYTDAIAACDSALKSWAKRFPAKSMSQRIRLIEAADSRCQACGAQAPAVQIDIDHIIPRARAKNRTVRLPGGEHVNVDDDRNLQVLCAACNRGKRDQSTHDFRPSAQRISETISNALGIAHRLGYDVDFIYSQAKVHYTGTHIPVLPEQISEAPTQ